MRFPDIKIGVGFTVEFVFRCWEVLPGTRDVCLCEYFSTLIEGGSPGGPSDVGSQGRDNAVVSA